MYHRLLRTSSALLAIAVATSLASLTHARLGAEDQPPTHRAPREGGSRGGQDEPTTPLGEQMRIMGREFRSIGRSLRQPDPAQKDQYLTSLATIAAAATKAREDVPATIAALPEGDRPARIEAYHKQMDAFLAAVHDLENAIKADSWEAVPALAGKLAELRNAGHKAFQPEKEDGPRERGPRPEGEGRPGPGQRPNRT